MSTAKKESYLHFIESYLHFYIGQKAFLNYNTKKAYRINGRIIDHAEDYIGIQPILRSLKSMTDSEKHYLSTKIINTHIKIRSYQYAIDILGFGFRYLKKPEELELHPQEILYLTKQGFDLFGLIPAGLAVDEATVMVEAQ